MTKKSTSAWLAKRGYQFYVPFEKTEDSYYIAYNGTWQGMFVSNTLAGLVEMIKEDIERKNPK